MEIEGNPDPFVTVATFTYPHEVAIIRGRLESDGIECFVQDELTVQVVNFYSNAVGGIKLQVHSSDAPAAIKILKEAGVIKEEDFLPSKFELRIQDLLEKLRRSYKKVILGVLALCIIIFLMIQLLKPSLRDSLTQNLWCLNFVTYDGKDYSPSSPAGDPLISIPGFCNSHVTFHSNGTVIFPGFQTKNIYGKWKLDHSKLEISEVDTLAEVFNGLYDVNQDGDGLTFFSDKTTIYCERIK